MRFALPLATRRFSAWNARAAGDSVSSGTIGGGAIPSIMLANATTSSCGAGASSDRL